MKKLLGLIIVAILLLFLLGGCVTQKRCDLKFPPQATTIIKDSIVQHDSITYVKVDIPVYIKGDVVTVHDVVYVDAKTGYFNSKAVYAETDFAKAKAQVVNSKIDLTLTQKDTLFNVQTLAKESYMWKEAYKSAITREIKTTNHMNLFQKIFFYMGLGLTLMGIGYVVFKFILKKGF